LLEAVEVVFFFPVGVNHLLGQVAEVEQVSEEVELEEQDGVAFGATPVFDPPAGAVGLLDQLLDGDAPAFSCDEAGLRLAKFTF